MKRKSHPFWKFKGKKNPAIVPYSMYKGAIKIFILGEVKFRMPL